MLKAKHKRLRAVRCVLDVYRTDLAKAWSAYWAWADGGTWLYDEIGQIAKP
jgi:hypothetical protein